MASLGISPTTPGKHHTAVEGREGAKVWWENGTSCLHTAGQVYKQPGFGLELGRLQFLFGFPDKVAVFSSLR